MPRNNPSVLIFGHGFIGQRIFESFPEGEAIFAQSDITNPQQIVEELERVKPEIIINTAAFIGFRKPSECEESDETKKKTRQVNITGAKNLAQAAKDKHIFTIHISTGYIFSGDKKGGWTENDKPNFENTLYSSTKIKADKILQSFPNVTIFRINKPIDTKPFPENPNRNKLDKLPTYKQIHDDLTSVTYIPHLQSVTQFFAKKIRNSKNWPRVAGVWHVVCRGGLSNREIMSEYQKYVDPDIQYNIVEIPDNQKVIYPVCILSTKKLQNFMGSVPEVHKALKECLRKYSQNIQK